MMKQPITETIRPGRQIDDRAAYIRNGLLSIVLMTACVMAVRNTMGGEALPVWMCLSGGLAAIFCMAASEIWKKKWSLAGLLWLLPWLLLLLLFRPAEWLHGFQEWINQILIGWNKTYGGGAALYQLQSSAGNQAAITLILVCICAELSWKLVTEKRTVFCAFLCFALILMQLLTGSAQFRNALWMFFILLVMLLSGGERQPVKRTILWETGMCVLMLGLTVLLPQEQMQEVTEIRTEVQQKVQELRYGVKTLPEGDLNKAADLKSSTQEMMTVQTQQEKNLYLRGFSGGEYDRTTGTWAPLSDAAYGNEYSGMLKWLKKQNFDPLTQSAQYEQLTENSQDMEENVLKLHLTGAQREYLYLPCTLEKVQKGKATEEHDTRMRSRGLIGKRNYEYRELSGSRPAELTMAEEWVNNPKTEEQKAYLDAESVYRKFVYDQEMDVEEGLRDLIRKLFWSSYRTEQDGIYSALTQIRKVLKQPQKYAAEAGIKKDESDPVSAFLTAGYSGNDMFYATAAVLAFRVHGIPARYAEGYYISENTISEQSGEPVAVTGQDAHAWVEVYFDGIGWLPLDVTPGYYYEAVELQQMVSTPDTIRKTAALENDQSEAAPLSGSQQTNASLPEKVQQYSVIVLMGMLALFVIGLTAIVILRKLIHWYRISRYRWKYQHAENRKRIQILHDLLYLTLAKKGIQGKLGWKTEELDQKIAEQFERIEPGMYIKACGMLEKGIYGEMELEPYEERYLQSFLIKLADTNRLVLQK